MALCLRMNCAHIAVVGKWLRSDVFDTYGQTFSIKLYNSLRVKGIGLRPIREWYRIILNISSMHFEVNFVVKVLHPLLVVRRRRHP